MKKPSSNFPPWDMIVWSPDRDWLEDMMLASDERLMVREKQKHRRGRNLANKLLFFVKNMTFARFRKGDK